MTAATSRARSRALAVVAPLALTALVTPWVAGAAERPTPAVAAPQERDTIDAEALYLEGCASCHGADGRGARAPEGGLRGPALGGAGEASAYYYLSTGRMPMTTGQGQPDRKPRAYSQEQIEALTEYVAAFGTGPELPDVDLEGADTARGGEIFRLNCQACHSASGSGGALSYGRAAPSLAAATPLEVAAAARAGPGQMPVFGPGAIDGEELDDLISYVEYLDDPADPGGLPIGRTGPIPEGFVAWLVGMGALLVLVAWIGVRNPIRGVTRR